MTDDLARIGADEQTEAHRREARKLASAIAGDVIAYHTALQDAGISGELLADLTRDFGGKWHDAQLCVAVQVDVSALYAEDDDV